MGINHLLAIGFSFAGLVLASLPQEAAGQAKFPTKPIQVIVAFQPGSTDIVLRPFMEHMPEYLGQSLSFVYKPGAGGALGRESRPQQNRMGILFWAPPSLPWSSFPSRIRM